MTEIHDLNDWDRQIIEEFRANGGNVGGQFVGVPLLLLTTTGAKSGEPRTRPLAYLSEGGRTYVFAGNRGAPTNPDWYHNLVAHPEVTVELGTEKFEARATVVDSAEWNRLGSIRLQKLPALAELQAKITRKVPVVLQFDLDWERQAQNLVAQFRADYARYPGDASFQEVIEDLQRVSAQFCLWWEQQDVRGLPDGPRTMHHPTLGVLEFDHVTFQTSITPDLRVKVYAASPATVSKLEQVL